MINLKYNFCIKKKLKPSFKLFYIEIKKNIFITEILHLNKEVEKLKSKVLGEFHFKNLIIIQVIDLTNIIYVYFVIDSYY